MQNAAVVKLLYTPKSPALYVSLKPGYKPSEEIRKGRIRFNHWRLTT
jgi:hypothetical protein